MMASPTSSPPTAPASSGRRTAARRPPGGSRRCERSSVSAPPTAISEVEAKNAVPFCSAATICASTMRISRASIWIIQMSR